MKKIIFWMDSNLIHLFTAKKLKEKIDCEIHAIFDVPNKPKQFLKNQNFILFDSIHFYHDNFIDIKSEYDIEFLKKKEEEYGFNFYQTLINDRHLFNFNDFYKFKKNQILKILELEIKFFEKIIDQINPDILVMNPLFLRAPYVLYLICKSKGVKILMPIPLKIPGRCIISDNWNNLGYFSGEYHQENDNFLDKANNEENEIHLTIREQEDSVNSRFLNSKLKMFKALMLYLFSENKNIKTHYTYFGRTKASVFKNYFYDYIRVKIRKRFIDKFFLKQLDEKLKIIYFPLHIEQEFTTLVLSPFYTNQLELINQISKSIPVDHTLVIKEHPIMNTRSWHSKKFYKEIMKLPNTVLIHPLMDSNKIIEKSSLVISIRGTASFEAGYYNKPTLVFSNTDYNFLPHIQKVNSIEELPDLILKSINKKITNEAFTSYLNYLKNNSFRHDIDDIAQKLSDSIYYGGFLVDVKINQKKILEFYSNNENIFEIFSVELIKKI